MQVKLMVNSLKLTAYYYIRYINLFLRTLTLNRIINYITLTISFTVSSLYKKANIKGMPMGLSIEPINICNLKCPECPTGTDTLTRRKGKMSVDFFSEIINNISKKTWFLNLYFQGEPTLHPQFVNFLKQSKNKKLIVSTSTNAHFISEEIAEDIVRSGLDVLTISVDGITQDSYQKYRVGGDLKRVKTGIKNLAEAKKKYKSKYPLIIAQYLVFRYNEHEVSELQNRVLELGVDAIQIKKAQIYNVNNKMSLIPKNKKYSRYIVKNNSAVLKGKVKNKCWKQWSTCVITWEGSLVPCCFDKNASYNIGNIIEYDIKKLWRGDDLNEFRNKVFNNQKAIDICSNCPMSRK